MVSEEFWRSIIFCQYFRKWADGLKLFELLIYTVVAVYTFPLFTWISDSRDYPFTNVLHALICRKPTLCVTGTYCMVRIGCDTARRTTASGKKLGLRSGPGQFFTGLITEHTSKWKNHSVSGAPTCCIWQGGGGRKEKIGEKERGG